MLLNVLSRKGDGCRAMQRLIRDCHETPKAKKEHTQARLAVVPLAGGAQDHRVHSQNRGRAPTCASTSSCRTIFPWTRRLSLYLLDTLPLMDPQAPDYAAGAAHPGRVHPRRPGHHSAQAAGQAEEPEDGGDEDGRASNTTSAWRSWRSWNTPSPTASSSIPPSTPSPTGIPGWARKTSGPNPSPARCSRNSAPSPITSATTNCSAPRACCCAILNSVFKVLAQTVPDAAKNDAVREMELYLGTMIRQVDSSLLDEWEKMRDPNYQRAETAEARPPGAEEAEQDITRDTKGLHRRDPQPHLQFPARTGDRGLRRRRWPASRRTTPTASRGQRPPAGS